MKTLKIIISIVLVITMCMTMMMPASAARVTYYLSDLKMAEAATADEAKEILKGAGFDVLDENLNPGGSKAVYLGYKKSTNVDDAITDIRVMNMNGAFNISDYNSIREDALQTYNKEINNLRIAANEFAENYKAGKKEAVLAYRQLNYYYVELNKKQVKMGDYMLNFPKNNSDFADILFKGNTNILNNIRILLAMGVADGGDLIERIKTVSADETIYSDYEYYDDAKEVSGKIQQLKNMHEEVIFEMNEIIADPDMTEEEKELSTTYLKFTSTLLLSFELVLQSIPCGDTNYNEYFEENPSIDYSMLYPVVAAMTPGQRAMAVSGQLHSVLVYNAVEMGDEELEAELTKTEDGLEPMSVYFGTDMNLLEGAIGITSDAIREEGATGKTWFACFTGNMAGDITISSLFGAGGIAITRISAHFLKQQNDISNTTEWLPEDAMEEFYCNDQLEINEFMYNEGSRSYEQYSKVYDEMSKRLDDVNAKYTVSNATVAFSCIGLVIGLAMIGFSIYSIIRIVDAYNPEYTKIPSNMVESVSTANGSRFINYTVVNSMYKDGDKIAEKPGDTNGYDGDQWNAVYYTKSYEAGKCMTATGYFIDSASNFGKYTPIAAFDENKCYDLNSYNDNDNDDNIFIAFGNSNNKKTAETSVPTVIGSVFAYGTMAITGVIGLGIGMCIVSLAKRKKVN